MSIQAQINMQKQDQQLGFDILGRLFSAAENYYLKCIGAPYDQKSTNYSSYDMFHNANKKSKETVRRELINQINIFQTSNKYFMNKYNQGLQPPNLNLAIADLNLWKNSMKSQKDIELYDAILQVVNNNQVNTDIFTNDIHKNEFKNGRQEFWSNMGTYASAATQQRIEEINTNPNHQPTFNRGGYHGNTYESTKPGFFDEKSKLQNDVNKILENLVTQLYNYNEGEKYLINNINENYINLVKLIKKIDENSAFIFPESIITKKQFVSNLENLIKIENKRENKKIFNNLKDLFVESFL